MLWTSILGLTKQWEAWYLSYLLSFSLQSWRHTRCQCQSHGELWPQYENRLIMLDPGTESSPIALPNGDQVPLTAICTQYIFPCIWAASRMLLHVPMWSSWNSAVCEEPRRHGRGCRWFKCYCCLLHNLDAPGNLFSFFVKKRNKILC